MDLRPYQQECVKALAEARQSGETRGIVSMACGLGKTVTAITDVEQFLAEHPGAKVLFLCHNSDILLQAKKRFAEHFGPSYSCDLFVSSAKKVSYREKPRPVRFLFASFQTMLGRRQLFSAEEFDYIVTDEAHHSRAETYEPTITYFRSKFLLGLTATPFRRDGQRVETVFGRVVYEMDIVDGILEGWLAAIDYYLMVDGLEDEATTMKMKQLNQRVSMKLDDGAAVQIIKEEAAAEENPRVMIYCRTVKHAEKVARFYGEKAKVISGRMTPQESAEILDELQAGKIEAVCSVQKLNEGVDLPSLSMIVFLRNTVSRIVFEQQLGRGLRTTDEKTRVKVLDFVANSTRVEMVTALHQEIGVRQARRAASGKPRTKREVEKPFELNLGRPEFKKTPVDVGGLMAKMQQSTSRMAWKTREDMAAAYARESLIVKKWLTWDEVDARENLPAAELYKEKIGKKDDLIVMAKRSLAYGDQRAMMNDREQSVMYALQDLTKQLLRLPTEKEVGAVYRFDLCDRMFGGGGLERIIGVCLLREVLQRKLDALAGPVGIVPPKPTVEPGELDSDGREPASGNRKKLDVLKQEMKDFSEDLLAALDGKMSRIELAGVQALLGGMQQILNEMEE